MVQPNISMLQEPLKPEFMNKAFYKVIQKTQKLDFLSMYLEKLATIKAYMTGDSET